MKKYFLLLICFNQVAGQVSYVQEREEIAALDTISYAQKEEEFLVWREDETGQERRDERLREQQEAEGDEYIQ